MNAQIHARSGTMLTVLSVILTSVGVGLTLAVWWATTNSEHDKVRLEYVRLAIGLLQPPQEGKPVQKELRKWAVFTLQDSSPHVKFSDSAAQKLIDGDSSLPSVNRDSVVGFNYAPGPDDRKKSESTR